MKKLQKLKNSLFMLMSVILCLGSFISCSSGITSSSINSGQTVENSISNEIILAQPNKDSDISSNSSDSITNNNSDVSTNININNNMTNSTIPAYSGNDYLILNNNIPDFSTSDLTTNSFEEYSPLDSLGRCGVAFANIGTDIMPTESRESISSVKPSGWHSVKYDIVEGKYLYNRSHLIGFQLTAENANDRNLITGTRYFNATLMLPYENMVADYIKETNNHVLYRVTPIYEGNNLVATGVQMEAKSVEDNGEGIEFIVFVYNVQPGITIDYATGSSALSGEEIVTDSSSTDSYASNNSSTNSTVQDTYVNDVSDNTTSSNSQTIIRGNSKSKIYHCPGQRDYENMADSDYLVIFNSEDEAISAGYRKAKR